MTTIRFAIERDVPWLHKQLRQFADFFGTGRSLCPADDAVALATVAKLVAAHPFFIAERARDERERREFYQDLLASGLSDYEARGTAWPQNPDDDELIPIGFIAGALTPHLYNPDILMLTELFWWVDPIYRGSSAGGRLLNRFLEYGREQHVDFVVMTLLANSPIEADALEARGFKLHERSFLLELSSDVIRAGHAMLSRNEILDDLVYIPAPIAEMAVGD